MNLGKSPKILKYCLECFFDRSDPSAHLKTQTLYASEYFLRSDKNIKKLYRVYRMADINSFGEENWKENWLRLVHVSMLLNKGLKIH